MIGSRFQASVLALTLLAVPGAGQPPDKKDPQSTVEPRSAPGAGQKFLAQFVGIWDVTKIFYPRSGDPATVQGECVQTMVHDGRFLKSEFAFGQGAAKTTGTGTIGFEADSGLFTSTWTDSRSTRMSLRRSKDRFNGEEIVLFSKSLAEGGGETRQSRTVTRLEDNGRKIVHRQFSVGGDGPERLVMQIEMTRKGDATSRP
jgi:hypothetical protein